MNSDFIYVKHNKTQNINMLIKKTDLCIIELNKLTMNNKENLLQVSMPKTESSYEKNIIKYIEASTNNKPMNT